MSLQALGIEYKQVAETLAAAIRINLRSRQDLPTILNELAQRIPKEHITGPPFCIIQFVTSIKDGFDAEIGFPVSRAIESLPPESREVLYLKYRSNLSHQQMSDLLGVSPQAVHGRLKRARQAVRRHLERRRNRRTS